MIHRSVHAFPWAGSSAPGEPNDLPDAYGVDVLMLAPVDPNRLFATWHVAWSTRNRLVEELGEETLAACRLLLRLHPVGAPTPCRVLDVSGPSRSWYVDLQECGVHLWGEIGCLDPGGRFYPIARSTEVHIPWERPSRRTDPDWAPVEETYERIARGAGLRPETLFSSRGCLALAEGLDERLGRKSLPGRN